MRILIMFDLPTISWQDRRNYTLFHRFLVKNGFFMMQESVYSKLVLNQVVCESMKEKVANACPKNGIVQMLVVTEKQFAKMDYLAGESKTNVIHSDERLIVL